MKYLSIMVILGISLHAAPTNKEADVKKYYNQSEVWKKELSQIMNKKDKKIDTSNYLKNLQTGKDGLFYGKKMATMKLPERKIEQIKPEDRAALANKVLLDREAKELAKKSKNMAKVFRFLKTYGAYPRKDGDFKDEKEVYELLESKQVKLTSERIRKPKTKIKVKNNFRKLSK